MLTNYVTFPESMAIQRAKGRLSTPFLQFPVTLARPATSSWDHSWWPFDRQVSLHYILRWYLPSANQPGWYRAPPPPIPFTVPARRLTTTPRPNKRENSLAMTFSPLREPNPPRAYIWPSKCHVVLMRNYQRFNQHMYLFVWLHICFERVGL
jgi:hypothetical protein